MSVSINVHANRDKVFEVSSKIVPSSGAGEMFQMDAYPTINIRYGEHGENDVTLFPSFDQVKKLHQELSRFIQTKEFCEEAYLQSEQRKQDLQDELEIIMED